MDNAQRPVIYLGDHTALTRTVFGHKMYLDTRDISLAPHLMLDGYWEMWVTKVFLRIVQHGMTVIDIGANLGYFTLLAGHQVGPQGKVIAVEANPEIYKHMANSVEVNGFLGRTELVNKGIMDKDGELTFYRFKHHQGSSGFHAAHAVAEQFRDQIDEIKIPCVTLDSLVQGRNLTIDVVKIDAEGAEPAIVRGAEGVLNAFPSIKVLMEYTSINKVAVDQLREWGFNMWLIDYDATLKPVTQEDLDQRTDCVMLYFSREQ